jgi:hypothetical protein
LTLACTAIPMLGQWWLLPSPNELASLRARKDELTASIARLDERGGRIDLRRCGGTDRLCVRVDRSAPTYGQSGDYLVIKGY